MKKTIAAAIAIHSKSAPALLRDTGKGLKVKSSVKAGAVQKVRE